jgi:hypothetical protein
VKKRFAVAAVLLMPVALLPSTPAGATPPHRLPQTPPAASTPGAATQDAADPDAADPDAGGPDAGGSIAGSPVAGTTAVIAAAPSPPTATATPALVWPDAPPCTTGTGVHEFAVKGSGFHPGEILAVSVGAEKYGPTTADEHGAYTATLRIRSTPAGAYPIEVKGERGTKALGRLEVGYSACRSTVDGKLRLTGAGFAARDTITVTVDGSPASTVKSSATGDFDYKAVCVPGSHRASVADAHDRELAFDGFSC